MEARKRSANLMEFAQRLGPNEVEIRRGNEGVEYLRNLISQNIKSVSVARCIPSGSYKRKTAISCHYDIDIIFFFNISVDNFLRSRSSICDEMERILKQSNCVKVKSKTEQSVCCEWNGIEYDLVTAISLYPNNWRQQYQKIREIVEEKRGDREKMEMHRQLSTSVCEAMSDFMVGMDSYTHCLCRLAKYWMLKKLPDVTFSGKSSTIELLAVRAAEETSRQQDILIGFRQFLTILSEIDDQQIFWSSFYEQNKIPKWMWSYNSLLLDPCDPFNNRLYCFSKRPDLAPTFKSAANKSLKILEEWKQSSSLEPQDLFDVRQVVAVNNNNGQFGNLGRLAVAGVATWFLYNAFKSK